MPFFRYTAKDSTGNEMEGTVQAPSTADAARQLAARGFAVTAIMDPSKGAKATFRTRKGTDRQRFFLFSQLAQQLKAGIAPTQSFNTLASQPSHGAFSESLRRLAALTAEGSGMADVMALYPDLYPEHVVGLVRAGEVGGFLPEACATISEQAGSAHRFRIFHWFVWVIVVSGVLLIPAVYMMMSAFANTFKIMWQGGDNVNSAWVWRKLGETLWALTISAPGITFLSFYAGLFGFIRYVGRRNGKRFRHKLGLRWPVIGKRAVFECVTIFTWALARLSRGGVAPQTAWTLAADCSPNLIMRDRLATAGKLMHAGSRVSEAVFQSNCFPEEYAPMVSTGEMIGNLPDALEQLAQASRGEFESQTQYSKLRTYGWGCLALFATSMLGFATLYFVYGKLLSWLSDHAAD